MCFLYLTRYAFACQKNRTDVYTSYLLFLILNQQTHPLQLCIRQSCYLNHTPLQIVRKNLYVLVDVLDKLQTIEYNRERSVRGLFRVMKSINE
jgi:hypothetical protein